MVESEKQNRREDDLTLLKILPEKNQIQFAIIESSTKNNFCGMNENDGKDAAGQNKSFWTYDAAAENDIKQKERRNREHKGISVITLLHRAMPDNGLKDLSLMKTLSDQDSFQTNSASEDPR